MIQPVHFRLSCDAPDCVDFLRHDSEYKLREIAESVGWTLGRRLDGQRAARGGKDYCPIHKRKDLM
jgi:hypothetical protein